MWLRYLEVLKHQERLNDTEKGRNDDFRSCKTLRKVNSMYLEVKLKEYISLMSVQDIKQGRADVFRGKIERS